MIPSPDDSESASPRVAPAPASAQRFARRLALAAGRIEREIRSRSASLEEIRFFINWADALLERAAWLAERPPPLPSPLPLPPPPPPC